jgi:hypothetical protein
MSIAMAIGMIGLTIMAIVYIFRWVLESRRWPEPIKHPFVCEECGKGFKGSEILTLHLRAEHHQMYGPFKDQLDMLRGRGMAAEHPAKKTRRKTRKPKLQVVK